MSRESSVPIACRGKHWPLICPDPAACAAPARRYLGEIEVADGFNGDRATLQLCEDEQGQVLAVHELGWFPWEASGMQVAYDGHPWDCRGSEIAGDELCLRLRSFNREVEQLAPVTACRLLSR